VATHIHVRWRWHRTHPTVLQMFALHSIIIKKNKKKDTTETTQDHDHRPHDDDSPHDNVSQMSVRPNTDGPQQHTTWICVCVWNDPNMGKSHV
jgi:hypothetical protein